MWLFLMDVLKTIEKIFSNVCLHQIRLLNSLVECCCMWLFLCLYTCILFLAFSPLAFFLSHLSTFKKASGQIERTKHVIVYIDFYSAQAMLHIGYSKFCLVYTKHTCLESTTCINFICVDVVYCFVLDPVV